MLILQKIYQIVWGAPALILILIVGIYLTLRTGFAQIRLLPKALRDFFSRITGKGEAGEGVSSFQALCTALAATVGTGNLAGVAGAIAIGGPGAVFWMWICGILGMMVKLAEATLAVAYRKKNADGQIVGGPMYVIEQGMGKRWKFLAQFYAAFGLIAAFGVGNATQINTVIVSINDTIAQFGGGPTAFGNLLMGIGLAILVGAMLLGGAEKIGKTAEMLVPFGAALYLLMGLMVLVLRYEAVPGAFQAIFQGAFHPRAVTGGMVGSALTTLRIGISRGVFTNEAGMGTAGIAHGAARVRHPVEQGLMGIVEVFLDTIVICTMTALVILCSGVAIPYGVDAGVALTTEGFAAVLGPWVPGFIALALCLFALATVLGWGLYGIRCAQYLFGPGIWKVFVYVQIATVVFASVLQAEAVWLMAEIINGLMSIPNLIALLALSPKVIELIRHYRRNRGITASNGGQNGDFCQCKSNESLPHEKIPSSGSASQGTGEDHLSSEYRPAGYSHPTGVL